MPHIDILFNLFQWRDSCCSTIKKNVDTFLSIIEKVRGEAEDILKEVSEDSSVCSTARRRNEDSKIRDAIEVSDILSTQAKDRFENTDYVDIAELLNCNHFNFFEKNFPESKLTLALNRYYFLNKCKLKTELTVLYERPDFRNFSGLLSLLNFLYDNDLDDSFDEVITLILILVITPISTAEAERCFSTLKRIKTFLRNTMSQGLML